MASYTKAAQQWATFARAWYLIDGKMQPPGKLAATSVIRLQGKHKPVYHALSDCGDHVVIINTKHIAFSGNKWEQKVYSSHTGYPGGLKQVTATQLHLKDPTAIVKLAIYRMLPKNLHRRTMMQRLHLFPEDVIPEDIRNNLVEELAQPRRIPKRLDEYTQEEIDAFPMLWTPSVTSRNEEATEKPTVWHKETPYVVLDLKIIERCEKELKEERLSFLQKMFQHHPHSS